MKKLISSLLLIAGIGFYSQAQWVSIPDTNFGNWLNSPPLSACLQGNSTVGWQLDTTCSWVMSTTSVSCNNKNIRNLTGIQYFDNLRVLSCQVNQLTNFPPLPGSLTHLYCGNNPLSSLPALPVGLVFLECGMNGLSSLPVLPSGLVELYCSNNTLTNLPALPGGLTDLNCSYNNLTALPSLPIGLNDLRCANNQLSSIPSLPNAISWLVCNDNQLTNIPLLPDSLFHCQISNNPITCMPELKRIVNLDFSNTLITCKPNIGNVTNSTPSLASLPLCQPGTPCALPNYVNIPDTNFGTWLNTNGYSSCMVGNNTAGWLMDTTCPAVVNAVAVVCPGVIVPSNTNIRDLTGIQYFDNLDTLICYGNELLTLPSLPGGIVYLDCNQNQLATLPALPDSLIYLDCYHNQLTTLPALPGNLTTLLCWNNQLSSLPALPGSLTWLECFNNQLGSVPELPDSLYRFYCYGNPNLYCLPELKKIYLLSFHSTGITCLPNYPQSNVGSNPPLGSMPLCQPGTPCALPNYVNIPDTNFGTWLNTNGYSSCMVGNNTAGWLMDTTCSAVVNAVSVDCYAQGIRDINGIQYFDNLDTLKCIKNQLTSIPALPGGLIQLDCDSNQLTSLPALPGSLTTLSCFWNQLSTIPVLPAGLTALNCSYNIIATLPALPASLTFLNCRVNQISSVPELPDSLYFFDCSFTNVNCLPELKKIVRLFFTNTGITCLHNYPQGNILSQPLLSSVPLCQPGNANGCAYDTLFADAGNDTIICFANSVLLGGNPTATGGTPPYTYAWSPSAALNCALCPNPLSGGIMFTTTFTVTITDSFGATATDTITITIGPGPVIDSVLTQNPTACASGDGVIALTGLSPLQLYDVSYYPQGTANLTADANGNITISGLNAGLYTNFELTLNGCLSQQPHVGPYILSAPTTLTDSLDITVPTCGLCNGTVTAIVSGGSPPYAYTYYDVPLLEKCDALFCDFICPGNQYLFSVIDASGCIDTTFFTIPQGAAALQIDSITSTNISCFGGNDGSACVYVSGGIGVITFLWNTNQTDQCPFSLAAGSYIVTVADANACSVSASVTITEPPQLTAQIVSATGGILPDTLSVVPIGGTPSYTVMWSNGHNSSGGNLISASGVYSVTVWDSNACTAADSISIGLPSITVTYPNGGETFTTNQTVNVIWTSTGNIPKVKIEFYSSILFNWVTLADSVANTGSYLFTIPVVPNMQGSIRISDPYNATINDQSDGLFNIIATSTPLLIDSVATINSCYSASTGQACVYISGGTLPYTYQWQFNVSNTSCANNLGPSNYNVTVTDAINNSVSTTVSISFKPIFNVQIVSATGDVLPDTLTAIPLGGTPPYTFLWSDASTNLGNTQSIIVSAPSIASVWCQVRDSANCTFGQDSVVVGCDNNCVWPGDADHNGIADNNDLLPIGLAYGITGPARWIPGDIQWYAHACQNWTDTLLSGTNYKHIDCYGNGIINADDTTAILLNFGLTHSKTDETGGWRMTDPTLYVDLIPDTTRAGDTLYAYITLGDANVMASNVYGLAFTLNYDANVVDSTKTKVTFGNSWFGNATDKISLGKNFHPIGQLKCAITRIDHTTRSGFGQIGEAQFVITTDNINGKDLAYYLNHVWLSDITMIDNLGNIISVNAGRDSSLVEFEPTGISNIGHRSSVIRLIPNPANDAVTISVTENLIGGELKLIDVHGRILIITTIPSGNWQLATAGFSQGIYFLHITTEAGTLTKRLIIAR